MLGIRTILIYYFQTVSMASKMKRVYVESLASGMKRIENRSLVNIVEARIHEKLRSREMP